MATYDFTGKAAFVTGASAGMGASTARAFAANGAAVALVDRNREQVERLAAELTEQGHRALALVCDVSDEQQVADAVNATVAEFGRLDMAFNNAGIMTPPADAADESAEAFDAIASINLRGVWASVKHELAQMRAQGSGAIVNCSSLAGLVGGLGRAPYTAAKHGVVGLTRSVALQYAPLGVRVNTVCPGTIETPMVDRMTAAGELDLDATLAATPMKRLGTGEEIAAAVLWLCSDAASYVTGAALPVDGGYTAA
ncbi:SDR family NAD(P)-dependent oxidoreductase [Streptomyces carpinensis]|uniref:Glucose 1-dehydrogenase n=1 Tax=Streptomyces carpinensis TaxID=66369 RepID=A0ABV1W789_9ACTN|nr:glucose 1-dehydrogenase [Streptomyces carpinensis]